MQILFFPPPPTCVSFAVVCRACAVVRPVRGWAGRNALNRLEPGQMQAGSRLQPSWMSPLPLAAVEAATGSPSLWPLTLLNLNALAGSWYHFGVRSFRNAASFQTVLSICLFNHVFALAATRPPQETAWESLCFGRPLGPGFLCKYP